MNHKHPEDDNGHVIPSSQAKNAGERREKRDRSGDIGDDRYGDDLGQDGPGPFGSSSEQGEGGHGESHSHKGHTADSDEIIHRSENQYEKEISVDPEMVMYKLHANRKMIFISFISSLVFGAVPAYFAWYELHQRTFFIYSHRWMLNLIMFFPIVLAAILGAKRALSLLTKRYALSRRFLRTETWLGIRTIHTLDMTMVLDVQLTELGPLSNITLVTSDKTMPEITINFISTPLAKEAYGYLTAHSQHSYVELMRSRRPNR